MPSNRPYNPNTKYGRRKARDIAATKYANGTQEYRDSIDEIGCVVWGVIIAIAVVIFIIIAFVSGPDAAIKWLK